MAFYWRCPHLLQFLSAEGALLERAFFSFLVPPVVAAPDSQVKVVVEREGRVSLVVAVLWQQRQALWKNPHRFIVYIGCSLLFKCNVSFPFSFPLPYTHWYYSNNCCCTPNNKSCCENSCQTNSGDYSPTSWAVFTPNFTKEKRLRGSLINAQCSSTL